MPTNRFRASSAGCSRSPLWCSRPDVVVSSSSSCVRGCNCIARALMPARRFQTVATPRLVDGTGHPDGCLSDPWVMPTAGAGRVLDYEGSRPGEAGPDERKGDVWLTPVAGVG